ncbi:hypothetical protein CK203_101188 [Vitis vinifera]|uniref:Uncharacterized protein n=1 Tax=Vitis vinifera TaxID=29760 RepID=A0A438ECT9_VITVI|nr:hypothetical protein CK203_101188 [Vitis vinifera]
MDTSIDARLVDASLEIDGGIEVISFGSDTRALVVVHETTPILQTSCDVAVEDGGDATLVLEIPD